MFVRFICLLVVDRSLPPGLRPASRLSEFKHPLPQVVLTSQATTGLDTSAQNYLRSQTATLENRTQLFHFFTFPLFHFNPSHHTTRRSTVSAMPRSAPAFEMQTKKQFRPSVFLSICACLRPPFRSIPPPGSLCSNDRNQNPCQNYASPQATFLPIQIVFGLSKVPY